MLKTMYMLLQHHATKYRHTEYSATANPPRLSKRRPMAICVSPPNSKRVFPSAPAKTDASLTETTPSSAPVQSRYLFRRPSGRPKYATPLDMVPPSLSSKGKRPVSQPPSIPSKPIIIRDDLLHQDTVETPSLTKSMPSALRTLRRRPRHQTSLLRHMSLHSPSRYQKPLAAHWMGSSLVDETWHKIEHASPFLPHDTTPLPFRRHSIHVELPQGSRVPDPISVMPPSSPGLFQRPWPLDSAQLEEQLNQQRKRFSNGGTHGLKRWSWKAKDPFGKWPWNPTVAYVAPPCRKRFSLPSALRPRKMSCLHSPLFVYPLTTCEQTDPNHILHLHTGCHDHPRQFLHTSTQQRPQSSMAQASPLEEKLVSKRHSYADTLAYLSSWLPSLFRSKSAKPLQTYSIDCIADREADIISVLKELIEQCFEGWLMEGPEGHGFITDGQSGQVQFKLEIVPSLASTNHQTTIYQTRFVHKQGNAVALESAVKQMNNILIELGYAVPQQHV
ncbi:uncharacterized protein BYT42DRAFT_362730 [Radiomyces spectabilis]|uniref:uncharacterized protein n=1 Tax=Radiomyces spectabilis TaxID=64574 RepID=UPI00221EDA64|nr:uncharacterized protein BYT42DRAFT_362730 [Radiomyces spectabilis]KAI8377946.1 hypothetical protein BYT42DRAFT_362730 [Radiomyces spectabilis]